MLGRLLTVVFYTVLGVVALGFIFSNREAVDITVPLVADVSAPLYVALAVTFAAGLLLGLSYAAVLSMGAGRRERRQRRAIAALEKEVSARELTKPNA